MNKNRWEKESTPKQRDLDEIERRNVVIGKGTLSEEGVLKRLAARIGWKRPSRFDVWVDRVLIAGITYADWMALFLCGFLLGYVLSALR